jgi:hypothetical protein
MRNCSGAKLRCVKRATLAVGGSVNPTHFRFNMAKVHLTNEGTVVNREYHRTFRYPDREWIRVTIPRRTEWSRLREPPEDPDTRWTSAPHKTPM